MGKVRAYGAQAVAACVYLNKRGVSKAEIKEYVESEFGYNLDINLRDIRDAYTFDVTCQGSVPIAIMAFLQCDDDEAALRLAISMGGDSIDSLILRLDEQYSFLPDEVRAMKGDV